MHRKVKPTTEDAVHATDKGWSFRISGYEAAREGWAGTALALANGAIGVRGAIDEQPHDAATFLAQVYETSPIQYHERLKGFAETTDTRVPVADAAAIAIMVDGQPIATAGTGPISCERTLDLATGRLTRRTVWPSSSGPITVTAERTLAANGAVVLTDYAIAPLSGSTAIVVRGGLQPPPAPTGQGHDPRIGTAGLDALRIIEDDPTAGVLVQQTRHNRITIAAASAWSGAQKGHAQPDAPLKLTRAVAYAVSSGDAPAPDAQRAAADACANPAPLALAQQAALDTFWRNADIRIDGDPEAALALRFNMFHVFQSAPRDRRTGLAAKGLTGEGYEGHVFWDGEVFALPMLAVTAPALARAMLDYRYATLDAARANARALDHASGALFAWRTIAGREASAHYPSGSAQYHINADVAFAIGFYDAATGDTRFLIDKGGEMLAETARIWLEIGHFAGGAFHIFGVTGPDEYTALIDDNWYTNRMAQKHLRLAADVADRLARIAPGAWQAVRERIALTDAEIAAWRRAADAMHLPFDATRGLDAQDASFLDKPEWDIAGTPASGFPLLLHHHPMTLYRHQVAKQADLVLALVLAGEDIPLERKRRAFDHYSRVTVHDSTLSDCSFSILASEVGRADAAMRHFRAAAFVDIDDLHRNTHHGAHMAAMGGSWQALVWGFGGFRPHGETPHFAPVLPRAWSGYAFTMLWRGTRSRIEVDASGATYHHLDGPALAFEHRGARVTLAPGKSHHEPAA